ncbi:MAG: hypothetical protein NZ571_08915 [Anaerolineae bacterium]|nr:hypothetical protein [Anaerolineae bacterium]
MRKVLLLAIALCLLTAHVPSQAQDEPILVRMVRAVPFAELSGNTTVSYIDYAALQRALPNSVRPLSFEDFKMLSGTAPVAWYLAGLYNTAAGDANLTQARLEGMREAVGFDLFSLDQVLSFGVPPSDGRLYVGRLNAQAVESAFLARAYTKVERDGLTVFCGDPNCDPALARRVDTQNIRQSDPFGGQLGRREPVALAQNAILSSPDMRVFDGMIVAYNSGTPSLAQNAFVQALLQALSAEGDVVQAIFFDSYVIGPVSPNETGIPPYSMAALVHVLAADGEQPVFIALVYASEREAQAAAAGLPERIQRYQSVATRRPFLDLLTLSNGSLAPARLVQSANVPVVLLLPIRSPAPTGIPAEREANVGYRPTGALTVFRTLARALLVGDLGFLAVAR